MSAAEAFAWHEREGAFERLSPPWRRVRVLERTGGITDGSRVTLDLGFPLGRWQLEHHGHVAGEAFHDRQRRGPFASWMHAHRLLPGGSRCTLEDRIEWRLPLAPLSATADGLVARELARVFAWRHRVTRLDLERLASHRSRPLAVGVTGASGFLGSAMCAFLSTQGHRVIRFVRRPVARPGEIAWDPARGTLEPASLGGLDAVVHLAGAGLADAPWTAARRRELVESRVRSTDTLARAMARASDGPRVLVSVSAIGFWGDRGDERLDESSAPGRGFLAGLVERWEAAADPARAAGIRVAHPRLGLVLWPGSGVLPPLAAAFRWGAGGWLGSGRAWWSWIALDDALDVLLTAIEEPRLDGPFAAVAPAAARQAEFARALGRALARPAWAPVPAVALRLLLGRERADEMPLSSLRVEPATLLALGYRFREPELGPALERLYGRPRLAPAA